MRSYEHLFFSIFCQNISTALGGSFWQLAAESYQMIFPYTLSLYRCHNLFTVGHAWDEIWPEVVLWPTTAIDQHINQYG